MLDVGIVPNTVEGGNPSSTPTRSAEHGEGAPVKIGRGEWPHKPRSPNAMVPATLENFEFLAKRLGIRFRFNRVKKRVDIEMPDVMVAAQNRDQILLTRLESLAIMHDMQCSKIAQYVLVLGDKQSHDPVADWIKSKPWDGHSRITDICNTISVADDYPVALRDLLVRKWLLSIFAASFKGEGYRARGVLTLQGGQGIGKTTWFSRLVTPAALSSDVIKLGHSWDGGSKDARLTALRHRIVELGELEGSFRKEIASLKAFITETADKIRPPYARVEAEYPRSTVFGASVNDRQFLLDTTGNSRFWTIAAERIDHEHDIDMQQVFAELKVAYNGDDQWWLTKAEEAQLAKVNDTHRVIGSIEAKIVERLDLDRIGEAGLRRLTANEVLTALEVKNPTNPQSKEANVTLRRLLGESRRIRGQNRWPIPWKKQPDPTGQEYFEPEDVF